MTTKKSYIIDECCLYHAVGLVDHQEQSDTKTLKVFADIEYYCNRVVVSPELITKYDKHISKLQNENPSAAYLLTKLLFEIFPNKNKLYVCNSKIYPLTDESDLPEDDKYLVRLAFASQATLVTADYRLIQKLAPNEEGISEKYGIRVLDPDQAIQDIIRSFQDK